MVSVGVEIMEIAKLEGRDLINKISDFRCLVSLSAWVKEAWELLVGAYPIIHSVAIGWFRFFFQNKSKAQQVLGKC